MNTIASPNGTLEATFDPAAGMTWTSLRHRGEEVLHEEGIPFLYPWANRLAAFDYSMLGKRVVLDPSSPLLELDQNGLPIHGLLRKWSEWGLESTGGSLSAALDFGRNENLLEGFPFPHTLRFDVRAADEELSITTVVDADQGSSVPVSFGFHPYFRLPGVPRGKWLIELPVRERILLDDHMIPNGSRVPVSEVDGPLGDRSFDDGFAGVDHARPFVLEGGGRRLEVRFDERFPFAQVYSPPGAEFICFEQI